MADGWVERFRSASMLPPPPADAAAGGTYVREQEITSEVCVGETGWCDLTATPFACKFRVQLLGPPDKPNLVFVLGSGNDIRKPSTMNAVTAPYARDFRVLSIDLRNMGETEPTYEGPVFFHAATYADDLAAVASVVFGPDQKFHVAGFSGAGTIAFWVAVRYPDRVIGIANVAAGLNPQREEEFPDCDFSDMDKICGDEIVWVRALMEDDSGTVALHSNTQLKPDTPAFASVVAAVKSENETLWAVEGYDRDKARRSIAQMQVANRICGTPLNQGLAALAPRIIIAGGNFDGLHKLARMRNLKKALKEARLDMFQAAHFQVPIFASEKIIAFLNSVPS